TARQLFWIGRRTSALLIPVLIALLVFFVRRIKPGQFGPLLHLLHQPALEQLVLGSFIRDKIDQVLGNDHGTIVIGNDDIVREDRAAAAADRLPLAHTWTGALPPR